MISIMFPTQFEFEYYVSNMSSSSILATKKLERRLIYFGEQKTIINIIISELIVHMKKNKTRLFFVHSEKNKKGDQIIINGSFHHMIGATLIL